jgi:hypothetical protein
MGNRVREPVVSKGPQGPVAVAVAKAVDGGSEILENRQGDRGQVENLTTHTP